MRCPDKFTGVQASGPIIGSGRLGNHHIQSNRRIFICITIIRDHLLVVPVVQIKELPILEIHWAEKLLVGMSVSSLQEHQELLLYLVTEPAQIILTPCEETTTECTTPELEILRKILHVSLRQIINIGSRHLVSRSFCENFIQMNNIGEAHSLNTQVKPGKMRGTKRILFHCALQQGIACHTQEIVRRCISRIRVI